MEWTLEKVKAFWIWVEVSGKWLTTKSQRYEKSEIKFGILEFKFNGSSDILKSIFSHTKWTSVLSHRKDDQLREMA